MRYEPPRLEAEELALTYVGHATLLIQTEGGALITDPILSARALLPKRRVAPGVPLEALPRLDLILISHAHFDHLDRPTLKRLQKEATLVTAPGTRDLLEDLGYRELIELPWGETIERGGFSIRALPIKHWGARQLTDMERGFSGYLIESRAGSIFFTGDSAYFEGFREVGERYKPDLALLPIGAYSPPSFRRNHMDPQDALRAFEDLRARHMVPIHWGTFRLSYEPLDEPISWLRRLIRENGLKGMVLVLEHGETRVFGFGKRC